MWDCKYRLDMTRWILLLVAMKIPIVFTSSVLHMCISSVAPYIWVTGPWCRSRWVSSVNRTVSEVGKSTQLKEACLATGSEAGEVVVENQESYDPVLFLLPGEVEGTNFPFFLYLLDYLFTLQDISFLFDTISSVPMSQPPLDKYAKRWKEGKETLFRLFHLRRPQEPGLASAPSWLEGGLQG